MSNFWIHTNILLDAMRYGFVDNYHQSWHVFPLVILYVRAFIFYEIELGRRLQESSTEHCLEKSAETIECSKRDQLSNLLYYNNNT